ncbi:amidase [Actinoplanes sp. NPDC051851]|uniref:amidase n=1 Tax=Actinoplanes sp. NPDC051851 TaxID=3154753 RepID=UPI00342E35E8
MELQPPGPEEIGRIAQRHGLGLSDTDIAAFTSVIGGLLGSYAVVDGLSVTKDVPARASGRRPSATEDPLNAWYWKATVPGAPDGPLAGRSIAVKDNIAVAGLPMMNGCSLLEGYVPEYDATVVSRVLAAGATITGKAACEDLCLSGGSHTCRTGPMRNPWDPSRAAGGSSGGSAILVATGEVDLALGGDQGGSIRIPASWCGVVGHKPTYGLVPYTGAAPIEFTLDHLGPIARTVGDVALLLDAIAGPDPLDARQRGGPLPVPYASALETPVEGLRIGVLEEGFAGAEPGVDRAVRAAAAALAAAGASVAPVSVPGHADGIHVWSAIATEGAAAQMVNGNGYGTGHGGFHSASYLTHFGQARATRGAELSPTVKITLLLGEYLAERYHGAWYAAAQNAVPVLTAAYDEALTEVDALVLPTLPMVATPLPAPGAPLAEVQRRAQEMLGNTAPFDVTGHPATTVPCGLADGLPVGLMIVARRGDDLTALRVARAYERLVDGFPRPVPLPDPDADGTTMSGRR